MAAATTVVQHPSDFIVDIAKQRAVEQQKELADPRRRVAMMGISGCGKTYATCTTFPGVIVVDYDNQIDDKRCLDKLVGYYPMWDDVFVKDTLKITGNPVQRLTCKEGTGLLDRLAPHLTPEHTVFLDSGSTFGDKLCENLEARKKVEGKTKDGEINSYWFWNEWAEGLRVVCTRLKELRCNVVVAFHEAETRDEETGRLEKYGIHLPGKKFTPRIPQFFTEVVRMTHNVTANKDGSVAKEEWLWQIKPTPEFPGAKSRCKQQKLFIPAKWEELIK